MYIACSNKTTAFITVHKSFSPKCMHIRSNIPDTLLRDPAKIPLPGVLTLDQHQSLAEKWICFEFKARNY